MDETTKRLASWRSFAIAPTVASAPLAFNAMDDRCRAPILASLITVALWRQLLLAPHPVLG